MSDIISFTTISAKKLDSITGLDGDVNTLVFADLVGVKASNSAKDTNFYAIVGALPGANDGFLSQDEVAYLLGDTKSQDRLQLNNQGASDPIAISAHGRINNRRVGDLTDKITFSSESGFGLDNGTDNNRAAGYLNDGDSLTFSLNDVGTIKQVMQTFAFTVDIQGCNPHHGQGAASIALDFDGGIIESGRYRNRHQDDHVDTALTIDGLTDGARIEINFQTRTFMVDGLLRSGASIDAFFDLVGVPDELTVGSLSGLGFSVKDLVIEREAASINVGPNAVDDYVVVGEDGGLTSLDVLANDSDPDSATPIVITDVNSSGLLGSVQIAAGGAGLTYDPGAAFQYLKTGQSASETFSYTIEDGLGATATASVTVQVDGANDAPTAVILTSINGSTPATTFAVNEKASGAAIASVSALDPDANTTFTYSVSDDRFEIVAGELRLKVDEALNFDIPTDRSIVLTITALDEEGASVSQQIIVNAIDGLNGLGVDGYIAGATVFADSDRDGELDVAEVSTTTDALGNFTLFGGSGPLVLFGGTDISTGQAFVGRLSAPEGSTVLTPLTTLVAAIAGANATPQQIADANAVVLAGLGLPAGVDLTKLDPIASALSSDPGAAATGQAAIAAAVQIQNTVTQASALLTGAGASSQQAAETAVLASLAAQLGTAVSQSQTLNLADATVITTALTEAGTETGANAQSVAETAAGAANVITASNGSVATAVANAGGDATQLLTSLAQVSSVAQSDATTALAAAGAAGTSAAIATVETNFTGANLEAAVLAAPVGDVDGANSGDLIIGTAGNDQLFGYGGNDTIQGLAGDDSLDGGDGDDILEGGLGFNTYIGGAGNDSFIQPNAVDQARDGGRAVYDTATGPITVVMGVSGGPLGQVTGDASVGTDTLDRVEQVTGTGSADTYTANASFLSSYGDNFNEFEGRGGDDIINGNGNTRVSYRTASAGVTVDLAAGTGQSTAPGDAAGVGIDTLSGVNQIRGSGFADTLLGSNSNAFESFRGLAGNDYIDGRGGSNDRIDYRNSPNAIVANLATGQVQDGYGTVDTVVNIERVRGTFFDDTITGDANANLLEGSEGNDTIDGGAGNDTLRGDDGNDLLLGGAGFDTFIGGAGDDMLVNQASADNADGGRADYSAATAGITVVMGFSGGALGRVTGDTSVGTDTLERVEQVAGSNFADNYTANASFVSTYSDNFNEFEGRGGNDVITGNGNTRISYASASGSVTVDLQAGTATSTAGGNAAGIGNDTFTGVNAVRGSNFGDILLGTSGNDTFRGQGGNDTLDGRGGSDRADYRNAPNAILADLTTNQVQDGYGTTDTLISIERIRGSEFGDTIIGSAGNNILDGAGGNDRITGGGGSDQIRGDAGTDTAVYSGHRYDYDVTDNGDGSITIVHARGSQVDGTDIVSTVELFEFTNATQTLPELLAGIPSNTPPTDIQISGQSITENSPGGAVVGVLTATDATAGDIVSFSLVNDAGGRFEIFNGGIFGWQIVVAPGASLDFETATSHDVIVRATDLFGATYDETITIAVTDVFEAPTNLAPTAIQISNDSIVETSVQGALIGVLSATDPNAGDTFTFSLLDDVGGRYQIVGDELRVGPAGLDFELPSSSPQIRVTDAGGLTFDANVFIVVTNAPPTDIMSVPGTLEINENAAAFTSVGLPLVAVDADATPTGGIYGFSLIDDAGGRFELSIPGGPGSGYQAQIVVANGAVLDYETATSHDITVQVMNEGGTFQKTFTIQVNDLAENTAPTDLMLAGDTIAENSAAGTVIGTLSATDSDVGDTLTFTLDDDAGGRFQIVGNELQVGPTPSLDYETATSHSITIRATDQGGLFATLTLPIDVNNVSGTFIGDELDNTLTGTSEEDLIQGLGGNDTLIGGDGNDTLEGGLGFNILIGGAGDDVFFQPNAIDFIRDGVRVDYSGATGPISVVLGVSGGPLGEVTGDASVGTDTLVQIDHVIGTNFADSFIANTSSVSSYFDNFADFEGGGGDDTIIGNGNTRVNYRTALDSVTVDLALGTGYSTNPGDSANVGVDTFSFVNQIRGSEFDDFLYGTNGGGFENFRGLGGNDYIDGRGGSNDRADYRGAPSGAVVNLATGTANDGYGTIDTLVGIERVRGSVHDDAITGDAGANRLEGSDGSDVIDGGGGNDIVIGDAGDDTLTGGDGDDTLIGGNGNDTLEGGTGFNTYIGGAGDDMLVQALVADGRREGGRADYSAATGTISVVLGVSGGPLGEVIGDASVGTDTLDQVEQIRGSNFADSFVISGSFVSSSGDSFNDIEGLGGDDTITGNGNTRVSYLTAGAGVTVDMALGTAMSTAPADAAGIGTDSFTGVSQVRGSAFNDTLLGNSGNESFRGMAGDDFIDGRGGLGDRADYRGATSGIVANLSTGQIQDGYGSTDTVVNIENVRGSFNDDVIVGNANANRLEGDDGNDTIEGGGGNDTLIGGAGTDTAVYSGQRNEYDVTDNGNGTITIVHARGTQADGTDAVSTVELFEFTDATQTLAQLLAGNVNVITGTASDDFLSGTNAADLIQGLDGDDTLIGLEGDDTLDGGANGPFVDVADYRLSPGGIVVNLATGTAQDGYGSTDTLIGIEAITDSAFNDTLTGDGNANWFRLSDGVDVVDAGGGQDIVFYEDAPSGVTVDLIIGTATDGYGNTDTILNFEAAHGSQFDDTISLTNGNNHSFGRAGNDTIYGLGGNDTLYGGDGDDILVGGLGFNTYFGEAGNDTLTQQASANLNDGGRGDYSTATAAITVVMGISGGPLGEVSGDASVGTDTLDRVEQVRGSAFADTYTANTSFVSTYSDDFNEFEGLGGDDVITSNGNTRASYATASAGVTVDLTAGTGQSTAPGDLAGVGVDTLNGVTAVRGSSFADVLLGSAANDSFRGQGGNDTINGLGGNDRADYRNSPGAIFADLSTGSIQDGYGTTDTVTSIERVRGSAFSDTIRGNNANNILEGLDGNDSLRGRGGADTLIGGLGFDTADYSQDGAGVTVNLQTGLATDGTGATDTLSGIEEVRGSAHADMLTGDNFVGFNGNSFRGLAGNDVIDGGDGLDEVRYDSDANFAGGTAAVTVNLALGTATDGFGNTDTLLNIENIGGTALADTLIGNDGVNIIRGLAGNDIITGGAGYDETRYDRDSSFGGNLAVTVDLVNQTATDGFGDTDTLSGIEGARGTMLSDTFIGNDEDNGFTGLAGNDMIDGGAGSDEVRYDIDYARGGQFGVTVNLALGTATDGFGDTDTLIGIERVRGTQFVDTMTGDGNSNTFRGLAGDDSFDGAGGNDWVSYSRDYATIDEGQSLAGGVVVNLGAGTATDSFGDTDTFVSIENATGGSLADQLTGSSENNVFRSLAGNDTIDGSGGNDIVDYSEDAGFGGQIFRDGSAGVIVDLVAGTATDGFGDTDTLISIEGVIGTASADQISGNAAANLLDGGAGDDTLFGGDGSDVFVFKVGYGNDVITDFDGASGDQVDLSSFAGLDYAGVLTASSEVDADLLIDLGNGDTVRLDNTALVDLQQGHFLLP